MANKKKVTIKQITNDSYFSLKEVSDLLGIPTKLILEHMNNLGFVRYTLFSKYTVLSKNQLSLIEQIIIKQGVNHV